LEGSSIPIKLGEITGFDQVEEVDAELMEDLVGHSHREEPFSSEHIMNVRLRNLGEAGEAAFGHFATADAMPYVQDETGMEKGKVHVRLLRKVISP
jgi:hypothetical protein